MKKNQLQNEDAPEKGLDEQEALETARRCLGEGTCSACELCSFLCPELCITRNAETGRIQIDLDYCKGCGICAAVCPKGAIRMVLEEGTK
jgi:2-oxoacid:acceptor oxidoreductase delta subunit (pyruvate/2-ketoisovalerate family)